MAKNSLPEVDANGDLKKTKFASKSINDGTLTIAFGNGKSLSIKLADVPEDIVNDLALHGISQMVGDSYAGAKGDYDFAIKQAEAKINRILSGQLEATRGSGESKPRIGELARAIARVKNISEAEAIAILDAIPDDDAGNETRKQIRNHPAIKLEIQKMRTAAAEAAASKAGDLVL